VTVKWCTATDDKWGHYHVPDALNKFRQVADYKDIILWRTLDKSSHGRECLDRQETSDDTSD
jgi:hypothetical protein